LSFFFFFFLKLPQEYIFETTMTDFIDNSLQKWYPHTYSFSDTQTCFF
jgi:hypothetical protein